MGCYANGLAIIAVVVVAAVPWVFTLFLPLFATATILAVTVLLPVTRDIVTVYQLTCTK